MDAERRWACSGCRSLLAVARAERLHIKIRKLHYIIDGASFRVTAVCRHCGAVTEFRQDAADPARAGAATSTETPDVQQANEAHRRPARKAERNDRQLDA